MPPPSQIEPIPGVPEQVIGLIAGRKFDNGKGLAARGLRIYSGLPTVLALVSRSVPYPCVFYLRRSPTLTRGMFSSGVWQNDPPALFGRWGGSFWDPTLRHTSIALWCGRRRGRGASDVKRIVPRTVVVI